MQARIAEKRREMKEQKEREAEAERLRLEEEKRLEEEQRRKEEERQQAKNKYLGDLQLQMENNKNINKAKKAEDLEWAASMELRRKQHQESVTKVMERKLQQLK